MRTGIRAGSQPLKYQSSHVKTSMFTIKGKSWCFRPHRLPLRQRENPIVSPSRVAASSCPPDPEVFSMRLSTNNRLVRVRLSGSTICLFYRTSILVLHCLSCPLTNPALCAPDTAMLITILLSQLIHSVRAFEVDSDVGVINNQRSHGIAKPYNPAVARCTVNCTNLLVLHHIALSKARKSVL